MSELKDITDIMLKTIEKELPAKTVFNLWFGSFELISLTEEKAVFMTLQMLLISKEKKWQCN